MDGRYAFYSNYWDAMEALSDADLGKLIRSMNEYAFEDKEPELEGALLMAFKLIRPNIDSSIKFYEAGTRGGRPKNGDINHPKNPPLNPPIENGESGVKNKYKYKDKYKDKEKDKYKGKDIHTSFSNEVIGYLNKKTGSHFRATTPKTIGLIEDRAAEGFTVEDFKTVIDNKFSDWGDDPEMFRYLRPETLFGEKFEGYLNERKPVTVVPIKRSYPDSIDCPVCGKRKAEHMSGVVYSCPDCGAVQMKEAR